MRIDPFAALAEYLGLQLGGRALVDAAFRQRGFRQLMEASPGWRELITLGKVWHIEQQTDRDGARLYDLIIIDAPATGHGVTFLDVPRVVVSAVSTGPLRRHSEWVAEMIRDQERTLLLPVALAEELPVRETTELVARVRDEIGIAVDRVVVNAVIEAPFPPDLEDLPDELARIPADTPLGRLPAPAELAHCAAYLAARHELNQGYRRELGRTTGLPAITLPYLPRGIRGPADLQVLGGPLLEAPEAALWARSSKADASQCVWGRAAWARPRSPRPWPPKGRAADGAPWCSPSIRPAAWPTPWAWARSETNPWPCPSIASGGWACPREAASRP
jgi:hypothetical protein